MLARQTHSISLLLGPYLLNPSTIPLAKYIIDRNWQWLQVYLQEQPRLGNDN